MPDLAVWRGIFIRPLLAIAIYPDRPEPGIARAVNIVQRVIANVQRLPGARATGIHRVIEYPPSRLCGPGHCR